MKAIGKLLMACVAVVALTGCKSSNLAYFSDITATEGSLPIIKSDIKIEPNDELLINVSSEVPEATSIYNLPYNNPATRAGGDMIVNHTTTQKDVEAPYVRVELMNFNVNVMGEVQTPGRYNFETERVSVLDALAKAGDMSVFGKRHNVTVWREEDGVVTYHKLNLNDSKAYSSPYFYLKQNDVLYVEPSESRAGQADYNQNNSYKVSVISAIVSGVSVITSLVIALVINKK